MHDLTPPVLDEMPDSIVDLTIEGYDRLSPRLRDLIKFRVGRSDDLRTRPDLRRRITEYVHVYSMESIPIRLVTINRRWARCAKTLGTTLVAEIDCLIEEGILKRIENRQINALISQSVYDHQRKIATLIDEPMGEWIATVLTHAQ